MEVLRRMDAREELRRFRSIELTPQQMKTLGLRPGWHEAVSEEFAALVLEAAARHAEALRRLARV